MAPMSAQRQLVKAQAALIRAEERLAEGRAKRRIECACGKLHAIKSLHLIVTHFYIAPYSCSSGDYWKEGEWNFVGPCGVRNRLLFNDYDVDWKERDTIGKGAEPTFKYLYRGLFKSSVDEHKETSTYGGPNNINYYPDQHRSRFELPEVPKK